MINYRHYAYSVIWSVEDEEFVGLCTEFPSLSYLDEDSVKALEGIVDLVQDIIADLSASGKKIPTECYKK